MVIGDVGIAIHLECLPQTYKDSTGTIAYFSPELLMLYSNYSYKIDIWSTGILFYELICKEFPFNYSSNIEMYLKEIFKVVGIPNDKTWPGIFNNPIFGYNINSFEKIKNSKPDLLKIKRNIMNNMQEYGKEIIDIIISMLNANPKSRPNTRDIMSNRIFDSIKIDNKEESSVYTCLDNLYLRQIGYISSSSNLSSSNFSKSSY
jgi:serine/threonine protein kinase